jgi:hypothetical protein
LATFDRVGTKSETGSTPSTTSDDLFMGGSRGHDTDSGAKMGRRFKIILIEIKPRRIWCFTDPKGIVDVT